MEYAILTLKMRLESLNEAYTEFVGSGKVEISSKAALLNRSQAKSIEDAILRLSAVSEALPCTCVGEFGIDESCKACYPIERL